MRLRALEVRLLMLAVCVGVVSSAAAARLVWLQGFRHDHYAAAARDQAQERISVDLPRADLFDRNGTVLAASVRCPSLFTFRPGALRDPAGVARAVARLSGADAADLERRLRTRTGFTWLARKLPFDRTEEAEALCARTPGLEMMEEWGRTYPGGTLAANLLGCVGTDGGLAGLEGDWNGALKGGTREYVVMRDAVATRLIPLEIVPRVDEPPPAVRITVDAPLQFFAESVLDRTVNEVQARTGVALVLDPKSGDILAMAVRPTFDPNDPGASPVASWRNHAVLDAYEPGSTFKIVTLAAALDTGRYRAHDTVVVGDGNLTVGPKTIRDDHPPHHPIYTLDDVLTFSSNVGCARLGMALGEGVMYRYMTLFGFGRPTALGLKGETGGILRPPDRWTLLSLPSLSFGQELTASPLQLAVAYATLASGGRPVTPRLLVGAPQPPAEPLLKPETVRALDAMLRRVVTEGTGKTAAIPGLTAAGKTGTAQKLGHRSADGRPLYIAYFVGYAPAEDPAVVTLVMVDEPLGQIYGGAISAPAWAQITAFALKRMASGAMAPAPLDLARAGGAP